MPPSSTESSSEQPPKRLASLMVEDVSRQLRSATLSPLRLRSSLESSGALTPDLMLMATTLLVTFSGIAWTDSITPETPSVGKTTSSPLSSNV